MQADAALLGELDRVVEQVEQDLAHAHHVAQQPLRRVVRERAVERESALFRSRRAQAGHLAHQRMQVERLRIDSPVGLDAREVGASLTGRIRCSPARRMLST